MSEDYLSLRLARLGAQLEGPEVKATGKGKVKPKPPWLDNNDDDEDESDSDGTDDDQDEDGVKPPVPPKRKRGSKAAARPTVWGPPKQRVDITRARGDGVMDATASDRRVNREARRRFYDDPVKPRRGRAGGNGVTAGRSNGAAVAHVPGNVRGRRRGGGGPSPSGEMGEGAAWGRSGSYIEQRKPKNVTKSLWSYTPGEVEAAMSVAQKALGGVLSDLRESPEAR